MKAENRSPKWPDFGPIMRRPALFGLCVGFCLLLATGLFTMREKSDFVFWHKTRISEPWPSSQFWEKLSGATRSANRCSYSGCSVVQNRSRSSVPYNLHDTAACPFYFRWIHEDLATWTKDGISQEMLKRGSSTASFRVVIKSDRLYVDPHTPCFQTRSVFTVWGLLQLINFYPGLVPDVELLFSCGDTPRLRRSDSSVQSPPPIFSYCSTVNSFDIPFPDWSFWGWPEVDLSAWDGELTGILKGENELLWEKRQQTAFWKGNTDTGGALRRNLRNCNGQYKAQIIHQDWGKETRSQFKDSRLPQQCKNRYKIYVEGWGWSVSLKYIMACDSPVLIVDPVFFDFFSRGLVPKEHFWPVRPDRLCDSIKFGVEWGNNHTIEAETMGRAGRQFVTKDVSMKNVYDYMLHALREYAKLLKFEPTPENMTAVCSEAFLCQAPSNEHHLYMESMVLKPSDTRPCSLPSRDEELIKATVKRNSEITRQIHEAENLA